MRRTGETWNIRMNNCKSTHRKWLKRRYFLHQTYNYKLLEDASFVWLVACLKFIGLRILPCHSNIVWLPKRLLRPVCLMSSESHLYKAILQLALYSYITTNLKTTHVKRYFYYKLFLVASYKSITSSKQTRLNALFHNTGYNMIV